MENNKKALAVMDDLGLKDGQQINEDDLLTVVKAYYGDKYPEVMSDLLNSPYFKTVYVVDLKAHLILGKNLR
ncbi:MAG: hypothetical protein NWE92_10880 [Candidatus Bathyarchaeota archaeon]|nr:hypothetical protein [Candidatus Bathyarchaeota archaeon]